MTFKKEGLHSSIITFVLLLLIIALTPMQVFAISTALTVDSVTESGELTNVEYWFNNTDPGYDDITAFKVTIDAEYDCYFNTTGYLSDSLGDVSYCQANVTNHNDNVTESAGTYGYGYGYGYGYNFGYGYGYGSNPFFSTGNPIRQFKFSIVNPVFTSGSNLTRNVTVVGILGDDELGSKTESFTVTPKTDTTDPTVSLYGIGAVSTTSATVQANISDASAIANITIALDNGSSYDVSSYTQTQFSHTLTALDQGITRYNVTVYDVFGNSKTNRSNENSLIDVDSQAPTITLVAPSANESTLANQSLIKFEIDDRNLDSANTYPLLNNVQFAFTGNTTIVTVNDSFVLNNMNNVSVFARDTLGNNLTTTWRFNYSNGVNATADAAIDYANQTENNIDTQISTLANDTAKQALVDTFLAEITLTEYNEILDELNVSDQLTAVKSSITTIRSEIDTLKTSGGTTAQINAKLDEIVALEASTVKEVSVEFDDSNVTVDTNTTTIGTNEDLGKNTTALGISSINTAAYDAETDTLQTAASTTTQATKIKETRLDGTQINTTRFKVNLSFSGLSDTTLAPRIVLNIPKDFASDISSLTASDNIVDTSNSSVATYKVLDDDPVISWSFSDSSGSKSASYKINGNVQSSNVGSLTPTVTAVARASATTAAAAASSSSSSGSYNYKSSTSDDYKTRKTAIHDLIAGKNVVSFEGNELYVNEVKLTLKNNDGRKRITIGILNEKPEDILSMKSMLLDYLEINAEVTPDNIKSAQICFEISKDSLDKLSAEDISLYRYNNEAWNELATEISREFNDEIVYCSETPGFSYFAIAESNSAYEERLEREALEDNAMRDGKDLDGKDLEGGEKAIGEDTSGRQDGVDLDKAPLGAGSKAVIWIIIILVVVGLGWYYKENHLGQKITKKRKN